MPKSSERRKEEAAAVVASSTSSTPNESGAAVVSPGQIKCIMFGVGTIVFLNLVLTVVAVVLGLQVKSEVDGIASELEPIMELASSLESMTGSGGGGGDGDGGMPTP
mmetsp:Transcript_10699/g.16792  ORF Transcript_10699/g.16792 Transcript_10699/m.16792 type:complete len:107 (-) Transcript_10699:104-424(-)